MRPPPKELEGFLAPYDKAITALTLPVRGLVLDEAPSAIETIYNAYNAVALGYAFNGRLKDSFCHVAVYGQHVNLGFNQGAKMPDPRGVLEGSDKQVRHISIRRRKELEQPWLRRYVRAAIAQLGGPLASGAEGSSIVKGSYPKKRRPHA
jgi:hypothetical protein